MNFIQAVKSRRRLDRLPEPAKQVAVVVPLGTRPGMTDDERTSLLHLRHHLGNYDKFVVASPETHVDFPADFTEIRMNPKYFGSAIAHARMQMSPEFYEHFLAYDYILIYHLDALVFSDELREWCDKGYDFIGAPWFKTPDTEWVENPTVGNTGFALMRVRSFLKVLYSLRRRRGVRESLANAWRSSNAGGRFGGTIRAFSKLGYARNNVATHIELALGKGLASDLFWSRDASHFYPDFRVATASEALPFAFEVDPAGCFERNGFKLPFGCHAWEKYDRGFWSAHLIQDLAAFSSSVSILTHL